MGNAVLCDQCRTLLELDSRGEDLLGERAAWITLGIAGEDFEVCSTSCAIEFLQRDEVLEAIADVLELTSRIARTTREGREEEQ